MSEIDVSKCRRYMSIDGCCLASYEENELGGSWEFCKDNPDCYYKQLQQLKAEKEKYKQCLDEIEKIANDDSFPSDFDVYEERDFYFNQLCKIDSILQKIKQAKEGEE